MRIWYLFFCVLSLSLLLLVDFVSKSLNSASWGADFIALRFYYLKFCAYLTNFIVFFRNVFYWRFLLFLRLINYFDFIFNFSPLVFIFLIILFLKIFLKNIFLWPSNQVVFLVLRIFLLRVRVWRVSWKFDHFKSIIHVHSL